MSKAIGDDERRWRWPRAARNPKGAGGLRAQTASELLPDGSGIGFVALPCLSRASPLRAAAPHYSDRLLCLPSGWPIHVPFAHP